MKRHAILMIGAAALAACTGTPVGRPASAAVADLAPGGTLRVAINFGNPVLAARDASSGQPLGVSVDMARELARRLDVVLDMVTYPAAGKAVEGISSGECDVAFVAIDPGRAVDLDYTAPYVLIEGAYLVPEGSPIRANADVDRKGVHVVVGRGSVYDLFLTRELEAARIERAPTSPAVTDMMVARGFEVAAGVKQQLEADAKRLTGLRLLDGRFMVIQQAMATRKGRPAGLRYLADFVEEMKATGFVAAALARHGIQGAGVAPPAGK